MKKLIYFFILIFTSCGPALAQTFPRPDVCRACVEDTSGGYISIEDTVKWNPVCNFELLAAANLQLVHSLKLSRKKIRFYPRKLDQLYKRSGENRGHVIPFEDLAWSKTTAKSSMNLRRNLAPEPKKQNDGTKYACEDTTRLLARQFGHVLVWGGTWGSNGNVKGINIPSVYWTVVMTAQNLYVYWMPTTGLKTGFKLLKDCHIGYPELVSRLGFNPRQIFQ